MQIVETREEFDVVLAKLQSQQPIIVPVLTDSRKHPATNTLCFVGMYLPATHEVFGLPFNHSEAINLPISYLKEITGSYATPSKKDMLYVFADSGCIQDLQAVEYILIGSVTDSQSFLPSILRQLQTKYYRYADINKALPLVKWMDFTQEYGAFLSGLIQSKVNLTEDSYEYNFITNTAIPVLQHIENAGLHVDFSSFNRHFGPRDSRLIENDRVFSQYNLFTSTGRPSCKFGGINFSAVNKTDGSRTAFTSRFSSGVMVLLDFESYHLRLISQLIGYKLPDMPVHEYFGRQYFKTNSLTQEQYDESKKKSFYSLYSDTQSEIPFFKQVTDYKNRLWKEINMDGFILSPKRKRIKLEHIWEPSPAKVFNYLIQWIETERNLSALSKIVRMFDGKQSQIVLYNYDAILIDFCLDDGLQLLRDTAEVLENFDSDQRFPVRMYYGKSYGELKKMDV